jgi:hypothetical protein
MSADRQTVAKDPELQVLANCCAQNFRSGGEHALVVGGSIDWNRFCALARFHRVQGLAHAALASAEADLPDDIAAALSTDARSIASLNMIIARECNDLRQAFEGAGRPLLFLKGLAVAALAYRSPLLKVSWDIDLLIEPGDLTRAAAILGERGFELILPSPKADIAAWHRREKESVWRRPADHLHIELHTRVADNRALIPTLEARSPRQVVAVTDNILLPTFADEELVAYLAVHGASSAWFRLKWISDFAALLAGRTGEAIGLLYDRSQQLGTGRAMGQALLLADALFTSLLSAPDLRSRLMADSAVLTLFEAALKMVSGPPVEPTEHRFGTWPIHWTQFLLMPGPGHKVRELGRQLASTFNRPG